MTIMCSDRKRTEPNTYESNRNCGRRSSPSKAAISFEAPNPAQVFENKRVTANRLSRIFANHTPKMALHDKNMTTAKIRILTADRSYSYERTHRI